MFGHAFVGSTNRIRFKKNKHSSVGYLWLYGAFFAVAFFIAELFLKS